MTTYTSSDEHPDYEPTTDRSFPPSTRHKLEEREGVEMDAMADVTVQDAGLIESEDEAQHWTNPDPAEIPEDA
jgi:hypothetical protein